MWPIISGLCDQSFLMRKAYQLRCWEENRLCSLPAAEVICIALCALDCKKPGLALAGSAAAALARARPTPGGLPNLVKTVKARKCRLSVGSLMPVLVASNWKYVGWLLHVNRLLTLDRIVENSEAAWKSWGFFPCLRYAEGKQLCPLVPFAKSVKT